MTNPYDEVFVFPYGLYLGKNEDTGKTYVQTSIEEYVEVDPKWDGVLKAIATVPTLAQFYETLAKAGVANVEEYVDILIASEMLTLVDVSDNINSSVGNIYEWSLIPALTYEGEATTPSLHNMKQFNISTVENPLPFSVSFLTLKVLTDEDNRILQAIIPNLVKQLSPIVEMSETELLKVFVKDVRKLIQRRAAFFS
jgi:hypothetical protein